MMVVKSPADGIVYYGRCVRGKWSGMGSEPFRRGAGIAPNEVFMTVVQPRPMLVRVTVAETRTPAHPLAPPGRRRADRRQRPAAGGHRRARRHGPR